MSAPSRAINYRAIRMHALKALRERGPLMHDDLVLAAMTLPTNKNSAAKAIRYAEQDGEIWRKTNRYPWELRQREPHTGDIPPPDPVS